MKRVCFVCLGNYCRSPLAEAVFLHLAKAENRDTEFIVDSAGIGDWNVGKSPDPRSIEVAAKNGVVLSGTARQFKVDDFNRFDIILAMDLENKDALNKLSTTEAERAKIHLLREYDPLAEDDLVIPDPYYGGDDGFDSVYEIIDRSCRELLKDLVNGQTH